MSNKRRKTRRPSDDETRNRPDDEASDFNAIYPDAPRTVGEAFKFLRRED